MLFTQRTCSPEHCIYQQYRLKVDCNTEVYYFQAFVINYFTSSCIHAGLKLNPESMFKVLKGAGIKDLNDIAKGLIENKHWIITIAKNLKDFFLRPDPTEVTVKILRKWPEPRSWEELARVIENQIDVEIAQKARELSESGR